MDFFPSLIQEKKFIDTVDKLTIFVDKKVNKNEFSNIFLKDDTSETPKIIFADKGFLVNINGNRSLRLLNGKFINVNYEGNNLFFNFDQTDFNLSKFETKTITTQKIKEMPLLKLTRCIFYFAIKKNVSKVDTSYCNKDSINEINTEIYARLFKPLNFFILTSILIFLIMTNHETKNFKSNQILIFIFGVFSVIFFEVITNYSGKSLTNMLYFAVIPIIIFLILYFIFYIKNIHKNTV